MDEIPSKYLNKIQQKFGATQQNYQKDDIFSQDIAPKLNTGLSVGATVKHAKFGFGTVLNFEGTGDAVRVQIKFKQAGTNG